MEDIYRVVELLRKRKDMQVIEERDYIKTPKESGYRSYHLVVMYPVQLLEREQPTKKLRSDQDVSDEFLGYDRTFAQLQVPKGCIPPEVAMRLRTSA